MRFQGNLSNTRFPRVYSSVSRFWYCIACKAIGIIVVITATGCHFSPPSPSALFPWNKEDTPIVPERVLAVWSDSVLHQPGQPGVRGFGGRIYFYQSEDSEPVEVDGALAVYVFDADHLDPYEQKPLRKFVFTAEQFKEHFSSTTLGPSYSVWLPWDEVGGQAKRLSLIARFEGIEGGTVISDSTIKLLPGVSKLAKNDPSLNDNDQNGTVRAVGFQTRSSESVIPDGILQRRDVQTIDLPPSFQKHLTGSLEGGILESHQASGQSKPSSSGSSELGKRPLSTNESNTTDSGFLSPPQLQPASQPGSNSTFETGSTRDKRDIRLGNSISAPRPSNPQ